MSDPIYTSPQGLHGFQSDGIAQWITMRSLFCTWETGCGKSHLVLAGISLMVELGLIEVGMVVCEQNKLKEWEADFRKFTSLRVVRYMGDPKRRAKIRESLLSDEPPQVLITTYETSRNDLGGFVKVAQPGSKRKKSVFQTGPLVDTLVDVSIRSGLAIAYDESTKLGNRYQSGGMRSGQWVGQRGSVTYKAHEALLQAIRKVAKAKLWVAGLTGTPIETSPDNAFNQVRLLSPDHAGSIASYEKDHVRYRDIHGKAKYQNISPDDLWRQEWVVPFSEKIAPILSHKRKDDPDVRAAFPKATEEPMYVTLHPDHLALYRAIESLHGDPQVFGVEMTKQQEDVLFGILRQVAAHPMALPLSAASREEGTLAKLIVDRVGRETFAAIPCNKQKALTDKLAHLVHGQGSQVVVFSFFGNTVIPLLEEGIRAEGISVATYTGSMSESAKEEAKRSFRAGEVSVLVLSDAGARGLNLPEAQYGFNYELCLTDGKTKQRMNRYNRIDAGHAEVTTFSMVSLGTIEEQILTLNLKRQGWHETLLSETTAGLSDGDDSEQDFIERLDVEDRRAMFERSRARVSA